MKREYTKPEMIITSYEAENVMALSSAGNQTTSTINSMTYDTFF